MADPARSFRLVLLAALLSSTGRAQTPTPAPAAPTTPVAPAASEPAADNKLARLFAGAPPKYEPPKPETADSASPPAEASPAPRNRIIRLPLYLVAEPHGITEEEVLTQKGREAAMAKRYMGKQNGVDLALNAMTLTDLWKSIPLLGKIPFVPFASMTYDERAALIYERPEKKRRFNELLDVDRVAREIHAAEAAPAAAKPTK